MTAAITTAIAPTTPTIAITTIVPDQVPAPSVEQWLDQSSEPSLSSPSSATATGKDSQNNFSSRLE